MSETHSLRARGLSLGLVIYCAASFAHFSHNAIFAESYPSLPESLTPFRIMSAWLLEAIVGIAGYVLVRRGHDRSGLALMALYAALGFDGFAHYTLAPASAHSLAMNASIWAEAVAGALLLIVVAERLVRVRRLPPTPA
jgi:hypothetical protein